MSTNASNLVTGVVSLFRDLPALLRSPLARRVALIVFVTVLVIEAIILVPSYHNREHELREDLFEKSRQWVTARMDVLEQGDDLNAYADALLGGGGIKGVAILDESGAVLSEAGEPVASRDSAAADLDWTSNDGERFERMMPASGSWSAIVRIDGSGVSAELIAFIWRIFGLTMIISTVVTLATLVALGGLVLRPLIQLREVLAAGSDADFRGAVRFDLGRGDEIGDVLRTVERMLDDLATFRKDMGQLVLDRTFELTAANERLRASESKIRANEARIRAIMDNSPSYIYLKSVDGRYLLINKHVEESIGLPAAEIIGKKNSDFYQSELSGRYSEHDKEVIDTKTTIAREFDIPQGDGTVTTCIIYKFPVLGPLGDVESIGAVIIDISERKAAEEKLRRNEELLRTMFDTAGVGIVQHAADGFTRVAVNGAFCEMTGYSEAELMDPDLETLVHPDHRDRVNRRRESYVRGEISTDTGEFQIKRKDGSTLWVSRNQSVVRNPSGEIERYVSFCHDISDRVKAEEVVQARERVLTKVMNNVNSGILMVDKDLVVEAFNQQMLELFQVPGSNLRVGMSLVDNIRRRAKRGDFGEGDLERIVAKRVAQLKGLAGPTFEEHKLPHGIVETRWNVGDDGSLINVATDITFRKANEDLLKRAKTHAERAAQSRADLVAMVSHEVRTPMNGVLGMARLLLGTDLDEAQYEMVETIVDSGDSLIRIVSDLLDVSKLEAGKFELEPTPFIPADLIEQCVAVMTPKAVERGLALKATVAPSIPDVVVGDPYRLRQVIMNLVSNAIRFTSEGHVDVRLDGADAEDGTAKLTFSVVDTGDGIKPEDQERLFTAYNQGTVELARKSGGTGLGLLICQQLIDLMGGGIEVDSTLGEGSTFHFTLSFPIDTESAPEALRETGGLFKGRETIKVDAVPPLSVLQVEDNITNQRVVETILKRQGHSVISVTNGAKALERIEETAFDAIIMDRHMPVMNGIETTQAIRAREDKLREIPIVGVTAGAIEAELAVCQDAGMDIVLTKPVDGPELLSALRKLTKGDGAGIDTDRPILVIDDVALNRAVARRQLNSIGLRSIACDSGEAGLALLRRQAVALVLVDISMQGMDGIEFTHRVREREAKTGEHLPIVAMTGFASREDRTRFEAAGMDDVLTKPVVLEELELILSKWVGSEEAAPDIADAVAEALAGEDAEEVDRPMEEPAPFDTDLLGQMLGDADPDGLTYWIGLFLDQFPPMLDALDKAVASKDRGAIRDAAHAAKSAATSGAAVRLAASLQTLETEAPGAPDSDLDRVLADIHQRFDQAVQFAARGDGADQGASGAVQ